MGKAFIGREPELGQLRLALSDALAGHGGLFLLAGEPGIGKTMLAEQLAVAASQSGALVLWGRCWERDAAPAYWPWRQIARTYLRDRDGNRVVAQVGEGARELAHILPELSDALPSLAPSAALDPDDARFRLFDAFATLLKNAAAAQPLLLILEDLHAADSPSLSLLRVLGRELRALPILVLATYRLAEVEHATARREAIAALLGESRSLRLRGLSRAEITQLIESTLHELDMSASSLSEAAIGAIHTVTDGNPFFADALLRATLIDNHGAGAGSVTVEQLRIPDQIGEMLRRQLALLPEDMVRVLSIAAVIGREFDYRVVEQVHRVGARSAPQASLPLLDLLGTAIDRGVLIPEPGVPGRYAFRHPLMRETVYAGITPAQRIPLHRAIAEAMVAFDGARANLNIETIAHHFYQAVGHGCAAQALEYCVRAAEQASAMLAYDDAVRHWEHAVEALEIGGEQASPTTPLALRRGELLLGLGTALNNSGERTRAKQTLARAAHYAREADAATLLGRIALAFGGGWIGFAEMSKAERSSEFSTDETLNGLVTDALAALGETDDPLRARLLSLLARDGYFTIPLSEREALGQQAMSAARRSGEFETLAEVLIETHTALWSPDTIEERLAMAREALRLAQMTGHLHLEGEARAQCLMNLLDVADPGAFERETLAYTRFAERTRLVAAVWLDKVRAAMHALLIGRFTDVEWLVNDALQARTRAEIPALIAYNAQIFALRREQARLSELSDTVEVWKAMAVRQPRVTFLHTLLAFYYAETGQDAAATAQLEHLARHGFTDLARDQAFLVSMTHLSEVCARLDQARHAEPLYALLLPFAQYNASEMFASVCWGSLSRSLGLLATILHRWDAAEQHFTVAIERNRAFGALPWVAHTQVAHARMLIRRAEGNDLTRASEALDAALATAGVLRMTRLGEEGQGLRAELESMKTPAMAGLTAIPAVPCVKAALRREGDVWTLQHNGNAGRLKDSKGLHFLVQLLKHPGREFHVLDLTRAGDLQAAPEPGAAPSGDVSFAIIDGTAKLAYHRRVEELRADIEDAQERNDYGRSQRAREELEVLTEHLAQSFGLGGRNRMIATSAERARSAVTQRIKAAIKQLKAHAPALADHLSGRVKTGLFCVYEPDATRPIEWDL